MPAVTPSIVALTGFIAWALLLLLLMEVMRTVLVARGDVAANAFQPDNANLSPFMQRLARAHANCIEGLPIFGGLMLVAVASGRSEITDPLAYAMLALRLFQSVVHLISTTPMAVTVRFAAFSLQMLIGLYWAVQLLLSF